MAALDEARTSGDSVADHVSDHNAMHVVYNSGAALVYLKSGNWTIGADEGGTYVVDTSGGIVTATLPAVSATGDVGMTLRFKRLGANNLIINAAGSDHFDLSGITTYTLTIDDSAVMFAAIPTVALTWMEFGYFGAAVGS